MEIVIGSVIGLAIGCIVMWVVLSIRDKKSLESAGKQAKEVIEEAEKKSALLIKDAELKAKDEMIKAKEAHDRHVRDTRNELKETERRLVKREDLLDKKLESIQKTEKDLQRQEQTWRQKIEVVDQRKVELDKIVDQEKVVLERVSGMNKEEAVHLYLSKLEKELMSEASKKVETIVGQAQEEAEMRCKEIITTAIERYCAEHTAETTVSMVDIPNDDIKGRIIGREGRNIRAFEQATGVDVVIDDTPGTIVVSAFDPVRREIASRSMERLIQDGRIHPGRIEETVGQVRKEVDQIMLEMAQLALRETEIREVHPKLVQTLGRLHFRTSYGQNVLRHSIEVSFLCGAMAGEMGYNVMLAKRAGLFHDIGKAIDHEVEGGHPIVGAEFMRRLGAEAPEVINAAESHHEDVPKIAIYSSFAQAGDAISAARPGARAENLERYVKRMEQLEEVAKSFEGVDRVYAIQAGREVRVMVDSDRVNDENAAIICRNIARKIENEMTYPGEVKVTLVRETRVFDIAR